MHQVIVTDEHRRAVEQLLTAPVMQAIAPEGNRVADRLRWAEDSLADAVALSRQIEQMPITTGALVRSKTNADSVASQMQSVVTNRGSGSEVSTISYHFDMLRTAFEEFQGADLVAETGLLPVVQLAYAMHQQVDFGAGTHQVSIDSVSFAVPQLGQDLAISLILARLHARFGAQQETLDDTESVLGELEGMIDQHTRTWATPLEARQHWRLHTEQLQEMRTRVGWLRTSLDEELTTGLSHDVLAEREQIRDAMQQEKSSRTGIEQTSATYADAGTVVQVRKSWKLPLLASVPPAVAMAGYGFFSGALLLEVAGAGLLLWGVAMSTVTGRRTQVLAPAVPAMAIGGTAVPATMTSARQMPTWAEVFTSTGDEQALGAVQMVVDRIESMKLRVDLLDTLDADQLQRLDEQMLPSVVSNYLGLQVQDAQLKAEARTEFLDMVGLLASDVRRLSEQADALSLRRQDVYRRYLDDALGVSELDLDDKKKAPDSQ